MENDQLLTPEERGALEFEKAGRWKFAGAKAGRIRELFGISETVYYARLNGAIDKLEARREYPHLTRQLRSLREARRAARTA